MPKYKVLDSVAHNVCDSFTSSMNYSETDFVMGHLLAFARASGEREFFIDFIAEAASPIFQRKPLTHVVPFYVKMFWQNVEKQRSARALVSTARLSVSFDIATKRPYAHYRSFEESPYTCSLVLVDNQGVDHSHTRKGWWFPDPSPPASVFRKAIVRLRSLLRA